MCIGQNLLATGNLSDYRIQWLLAFFLVYGQLCEAD